MSDDLKRQWQINRIVPRELPEPKVVNQPDFKEVVVQERTSKDKMYGKQFEKTAPKVKGSWTFRRKLVRGKSIPVKGSK